MKQLLIFVLLVATMVAPAHAWRGIEWDSTYQMPRLGAGGLIFQDGDVLKSSTGNTAITLGASGAVTINGALTTSGAVTNSGAQTFASTATFSDDVTFTAGKTLTLPNTAYLTQLRVGTGSTPDVNATTAADGFFVEGDAEFDDTVRIDGAVDINSTVDISGAATLAHGIFTPSAAPATTASTGAGEFWMTDGSPSAADATYVSDGAGGTEQPQANELYVFDGTIWVPLFTGITP